MLYKKSLTEMANVWNKKGDIYINIFTGKDEHYPPHFHMDFQDIHSFNKKKTMSILITKMCPKCEGELKIYKIGDNTHRQQRELLESFYKWLKTYHTELRGFYQTYINNNDNEDIYKIGNWEYIKSKWESFYKDRSTNFSDKNAPKTMDVFLDNYVSYINESSLKESIEIIKPFNVVYKSNSPYEGYTETAVLTLKLAPNDMQDFENLLGVAPYGSNKAKIRTYVEPLLTQEMIKQFRPDKMDKHIKVNKCKWY